MTEGNELSSIGGHAIKNGDTSPDAILRAFRGMYTYNLLDGHSTSYPNHRIMWFILNLKYLNAFKEKLSNLF